MPSANQVRELRETSGLGLMECKRILEGEELMRDIEDATSFNDVRSILRRIVDKTYPKRY